MVPYYEADTLYRIMDNRFERVKLARIFYLEYLKLMNHYGMLDKEIKAQWKYLIKKIEQEEMPDKDDEKNQQQQVPKQPFAE